MRLWHAITNNGNTGVIDRGISRHLRSYVVVLIGVRQIPLYSATSKWQIWKDYGVIIRNLILKRESVISGSACVREVEMVPSILINNSPLQSKQ